jgi:two-component system sensor histidine kinase/response regulator
MNEKIGILYLDDEEQNLLSFQALFRRDFQVFTTTSAQEAITILNNNPIRIIFSDQKMPEVSGVEFFETILHDFPSAVRILITGYADMEAVIDAINKGQVYRYVTKPWEPNDLKICVENALEKFRKDEEIITKNKELEIANSELEKFVYSASHDLRAPLVSIKGIINVARMEQLDPKATQYLDMIERSTNKLNDFVSNIINYYQNNQSDELQEEINFTTLAEEIFSRYEHYEGAERIEFRKDITQTSPFKSDEHRIRMVLNNLISNAIKFSDLKKSQCLIDLQIIQNKEKALIKVADNGVGISPDVLPGIFEMFHSGANKNIGSGIGLYIARQAVRKLNGNISASSEQGKGTRFTFEIPNKA